MAVYNCDYIYCMHGHNMVVPWKYATLKLIEPVCKRDLTRYNSKRIEISNNNF